MLLKNTTGLLPSNIKLIGILIPLIYIIFYPSYKVILSSSYLNLFIPRITPTLIPFIINTLVLRRSTILLLLIIKREISIYLLIIYSLLILLTVISNILFR